MLWFRAQITFLVMTSKTQQCSTEHSSLEKGMRLWSVHISMKSSLFWLLGFAFHFLKTCKCTSNLKSILSYTWYTNHIQCHAFCNWTLKSKKVWCATSKSTHILKCNHSKIIAQKILKSSRISVMENIINSIWSNRSCQRVHIGYFLPSTQKH